MNLTDRDRAVLWHPYTQALTAPAPIPIERAEGVWLYTEDGRRILDGISSWWVNIHGHSHPKLNAALATQAGELEHVLFAGCTHRPAVELAERLLEILPAGLARVFYSDNGSTAVEVALKLAIQYWRNRGEPQRKTIVTLDNAYHGDTVGAMSASEDSVFTRAFSNLLFPVERVSGLEEMERCLEAHSAAAVLIEPMLQGAGGMIVWPAEFVAGVRRLCDRYGALMIADEVLTGFGRTGTMFACEHAAITPDIICLSKGLTAGYLPLGVTATTPAVYEAFLSDDRSKTFFHGHSYTANPLACAVGLASLDLFRDEAVLTKVTRLEQQLRAGFEPLRSLGDVRVIGGVAAIELASSKPGYLDQIGPRLAAAFLDRGLLLRPLGNVVYFMPPYCISESETAWALDQIAAVLRQLPLW
ncbi:MAG TPA: adenosylmethionine--8-amino-7-oxononanoate transaminase [Bryobacteraceae bacterium]|nr:adenosylmethionine--8-amino-7-oxononanoate transaminase [Bryobacteraceae bacterium]